MRQVAYTASVEPQPHHAWYPPHSAGALEVCYWSPKIGEWALVVARRGAEPSERELVIFARDFELPVTVVQAAERWERYTVDADGATWHCVRWDWHGKEEFDQVVRP